MPKPERANQLGRLGLLLALLMAVYNATAGIRSVATMESNSRAQLDPSAQDKPTAEADEPTPGPAHDNNPARQASEEPWLGLLTEEAPEVLSAQLGLHSGEGLVVVQVAPDSPAARAGLEKNDVLVEWENQRLVHPAQLRKLVLMRAPGDEVHLTFYRHGKEQKTAAVLGKTEAANWAAEFGELSQQWRDSFARQMREQSRALRESLERAGVNRENIEAQVRRSLEQARKAMEEALRQATNRPHRFGPAANTSNEPSPGELDKGQNAHGTVRTHTTSTKTAVKSDDTGSYVLVATPKKWLLVYDKDGNLLFNGEIESPEQQAKVPKEIWAKVQPMLKQVQ